MPDPEPAAMMPGAGPPVEQVLTLPNFPCFEINPDTNVGQRWEKWIKRFERLITGVGITNNARKRALLLHFAGPDVDIFDTLPDTGDDEDYDAAKTSLNTYFQPKRNVAFEVFKFRSAKQSADENLDAYHTRLRQLAKTCALVDADREIAAQIIAGTKDNRLRRKALREDADLKKLLETGRAFEISETQATALEETKPSAIVNKVDNKSSNGQSRRGRSGRRNFNNPKYRSNSKSRQTDRRYEGHPASNDKCGHCGGKPHRSKDKCPAYGKECRACKKMHHFARVCRSKAATLRAVTTQEGQSPDERLNLASADTRDGGSDYEYGSDDYIFSAQTSPPHSPVANITIGKKGRFLKIPMMIDSGASINVIDTPTFNAIRRVKTNLTLLPPDTKIYTYGSPVILLL